ncbi:MAG: phosphatase PAP2 family protein [Caulobacteraceae bacterium]|nr:phosphatase PAP2 family protein [Caulobacteraceae bacterium]
MRFWFIATAGMLAACTATPAAQTHPDVASAVVRGAGGYLPSGAIDATSLIGPPPAPDSKRGIADRAFFDESRALKDTPRWRLAARDNDLTGGGALKRYACTLGKEISPQATPVTLRMLVRMMGDVHSVGTPPKQFYDRKRPLIGNDAPLCVPREDWMRTNASYPSGHSMIGWSWALVLAEASPEHAQALFQDGMEFGRSRAICGVHFQSDIEAGRTLGAAMVARLHTDPAFLADLAAAKAELAASTTPAGGCEGG